MQFYTSNNIPTNLAQRSFGAGITRIMPAGGAPLLAMSGYAKKKLALQLQHGFFTKTAVFQQATVNNSGGHLSTDTVINIASNSNIVSNQVLRFQKAYAGTAGVHSVMAEQMLVTSVNSDTQIVVSRGFAGSTAAALPDATVLVVVGTAFEQGSAAPISLAIQPAYEFNYTQIFRNAWDLTGTLAATQTEAGYNIVAENKEDCMAFHAIDKERAFIFGQLSQTTKNNRPLFTMDGIESIINKKAPNNLYEAGATTTFAQLESMINPVFDYTTDRMKGNARVILCGGTAKQVINDIGRFSGTFQIREGQTSFGLKFSQFQTSRGVFDIIEHPLFNTTPDWKKMAVVLELSSFDIVYLAGRDTFHKEITSDSGIDATGGVLTSECTIELRNPFACAMLYNLRQGA